MLLGFNSNKQKGYTSSALSDKNNNLFFSNYNSKTKNKLKKNCSIIGALRPRKKLKMYSFKSM